EHPARTCRDRWADLCHVRHPGPSARDLQPDPWASTCRRKPARRSSRLFALREEQMSRQDIKPPRKRSLITAAVGAFLLACLVVGYGFIDRAQSKQEVVDWTEAQAVPTVALAQPLPSSPQQTLTLPGNIQPLNKAAIYARVNGYVKSWDHDIGSSVKAGQVLATIDAPDL